MPLDHEVTREVWEGKIPVEFVLAEDEVTLLEKPKPYYVLVPRVSYFPLVVEKVQKYYLSTVAAEEVEELWLDFEGIPLKWHLPIGVLFDLLKTDESLPWQITLHLKNFPEEELLHFSMREAVESNFIQMIKEADQLKNKAQTMNTMQKRDHKQLWNGLTNDRYDQFWSVNKKLMESDTGFLALPIRLFQPDQRYIQKFCKPFHDNGERRTVGELLEGVGLTGRVVTHGIDIADHTPLLWLAKNMAYPDNFVHLCIRP